MFKKGCISWNKGMKWSKKTKEKMRLAQVQRELNLKGGRSCHLKPVELSSADEAMKQEAIGSLAQR